jgi:hypothetical protein
MQPCGDCQPIELGGQPGGNGSAGGRGGRGGGGAGGDAFAIFLGGAAAAARSGVTLAHGVAGRGGNTVVLLPDGGVGDAGLEAGTGTGGAGEAGLDGGPDGGVRRGLFGAPGVARDVGP